MEPETETSPAPNVANAGDEIGSNSDADEAEDQFGGGENDGGPGLLLDPSSMALVGTGGGRNSGPPSIATTQLASEVGSVVGAQKDAFLKSFTFFKDQPSPSIQWGISFEDPVTVGRRMFGKKKNRLHISHIEGILTTSRIMEGDYLKTINNRTVGPSMNGPLAVRKMEELLEKEGYLSLTTANKDLGDDILVQATIIKPRPDMTYEEMGMVVWYWGYMCVKSIDKKSIFKNTAVKPVDHIVSINNILTENMKPEQFAHVITQLPYDITLTILRRKERATGKFG